MVDNHQFSTVLIDTYIKASLPVTEISASSYLIGYLFFMCIYII